jgi:hypothetical protein
MSFNELTGSIPSVVGRMTNLEFFNMRSSQIEGTIPSELGFLTKLGKWSTDKTRKQLHFRITSHRVCYYRPSSRIAVARGQ